MRDNFDYSGVLGDQVLTTPRVGREKPMIEGAKPKTLTRLRKTDQVFNLNVQGIEGATVKKFYTKSKGTCQTARFNSSGSMAEVLSTALA